MKEKYDYLIVGAGLAGATFAAIQKKRKAIRTGYSKKRKAIRTDYYKRE